MDVETMIKRLPEGMDPDFTCTAAEVFVELENDPDEAALIECFRRLNGALGRHSTDNWHARDKAEGLLDDFVRQIVTKHAGDAIREEMMRDAVTSAALRLLLNDEYLLRSWRVRAAALDRLERHALEGDLRDYYILFDLARRFMVAAEAERFIRIALELWHDDVLEIIQQPEYRSAAVKLIPELLECPDIEVRIFTMANLAGEFARPH